MPLASNPITRKLLLVFGFATLLLSALGFVSFNTIKGLRDNGKAVAHTNAVIAAFANLLTNVKDAETGMRGYLITKDTSFLQPYRNADLRAQISLTNLKVLTAGNAAQQILVVKMAAEIDTKFNIINLALKKAVEGNQTNASQIDLMKQSKQSLDLLRGYCMEGQGTEQASLNIQNISLDRSSWASYTALASLGALTLVLSILAFYTINRDILRRAKMQGLLESVLNSSLSGISVFESIRNPDTKEIIDFRWLIDNPKSESLTGRLRKFNIGKRLLEEMPGNKDWLFPKYVNTVDNNINTEEVFFYEADGIKTWFQIIAVKLRDGFAVTFNDVSEVKSYEASLTSKITELERSNAELEQFAFIASHDLQEPIRKILAFSEKIFDNSANLDADTVKSLDKIKGSAIRMQKLMNDILDFSRVGKTVLKATNVMLDAVLDDVLLDFEATIAAKNLTINRQPLPVIEADYGQIKQLFSNIISNGIKFSNHLDNPTIDITCVSTTLLKLSDKGKKLEKPAVAITFKDNGIGFDEKYLPKIFTIFQRLHSKSQYDGTGIGLAICQKITDFHLGTVTAKSQPNQGASFTITLPTIQNY